MNSHDSETKMGKVTVNYEFDLDRDASALKRLINAPDGFLKAHCVISEWNEFLIFSGLKHRELTDDQIKFLEELRDKWIEIRNDRGYDIDEIDGEFFSVAGF